MRPQTQPEIIQKIRTLRREQKTVREIESIVKVSSATVFRYASDIKVNQIGRMESPENQEIAMIHQLKGMGSSISKIMRITGRSDYQIRHILSGAFGTHEEGVFDVDAYFFTNPTL